MRILLAIALTLALFGCGAGKRSAENASNAPAGEPTGSARTAPEASAPGTDAVAAGQPNEITEITDQVFVYECPKCGMTFDGPGQCSMEQAELVAVMITYVCPADNRPVDRAGKCPRCPQNAKMMKTVMGPEGPKVEPVGN